MNPSQRFESRLTRGSITKGIFSLALPIIINHVFILAHELTDTYFVGRLGSDALAALSMGGVIIFVLSALCAGLGIGTVALVSRAHGEGKIRKTENIAIQAIYLGIGLGAALGALGFFSSPALLRFLGAEAAVLELGDAYLRVFFLGMFSMFLTFLAGSVFQGAGDTLTPMKVGAFSSLLNIALDPVMIFGLLGFPALGVVGAALATVVARVIGCAIMLAIMLRGRHAARLDPHNLGVDTAVMKSIVVIGLPGSLQLVLRSFSALVLMKIVAFFGAVVIAAYGVGGRLFLLFLFPGFGFGAAAATMVGQNLGAGKPERAERSALVAAWHYFLVLAVCGTLVFVFAPQLARVFNPEAEFVHVASVFFRYIAVGSLTMAVGVTFSRALQGAGDTVTPMVMTAIGLYLVQIPLAYYLAVSLGYAETGIWIGNLAGSVVNGVLMAVVFLRGKWKSREL